MAKKGRPKADGRQPEWMLLRIVLVLEAYNTARRSGTKHSSAVTDTVTALRQRYPDIPVSEAEVKRILAFWQPSDCPHSLGVRKMTESEVQATRAMRQQLGIPCAGDGIGFIFGIAPRPNHERINKRSRSDSSEKA